MGEVRVTQEDRDAAANAVQAYRDQKNANWQQRIRDGKCDDGEMVQAFARHRQAAEKAQQERDAGIADEMAAMRQRLYEDNPAEINAFKAVAFEEIATAIRSQNDG